MWPWKYHSNTKLCPHTLSRCPFGATTTKLKTILHYPRFLRPHPPHKTPQPYFPISSIFLPLFLLPSYNFRPPLPSALLRPPIQDSYPCLSLSISSFPLPGRRISPYPTTPTWNFPRLHLICGFRLRSSGGLSRPRLQISIRILPPKCWSPITVREGFFRRHPRSMFRLHPIRPRSMWMRWRKPTWRRTDSEARGGRSLCARLAQPRVGSSSWRRSQLVEWMWRVSTCAMVHVSGIAALLSVWGDWMRRRALLLRSWWTLRGVRFTWGNLVVLRQPKLRYFGFVFFLFGYNYELTCHKLMDGPTEFFLGYKLIGRMSIAFRVSMLYYLVVFGLFLGVCAQIDFLLYLSIPCFIGWLTLNLSNWTGINFNLTWFESNMHGG